MKQMYKISEWKKVFGMAGICCLMVACGSDSSNLFDELDQIREDNGLALVDVDSESLFGLWEHTEERQLIKIEKNRLTIALHHSELCGDEASVVPNGVEEVYQVRLPIEIISEGENYGFITMRSQFKFPRFQCIDQNGHIASVDLSLAAGEVLANYDLYSGRLGLNENTYPEGWAVFYYDRFNKVSNL